MLVDILSTDRNKIHTLKCTRYVQHTSILIRISNGSWQKILVSNTVVGILQEHNARGMGHLPSGARGQVPNKTICGRWASGVGTGSTLYLFHKMEKL